MTSTSESLRHEDRSVDKIVLHPGFDNESLHNDIALLKLQYPAKQRPHIDVVCLPKQNVEFPLYSKCVITGWGRENEGSVGRCGCIRFLPLIWGSLSDSNYSEVLKEVVLPLWNSSVCENALRREFGPGYVLGNSTLCAGAQGRDACDVSCRPRRGHGRDLVNGPCT